MGVYRTTSINEVIGRIIRNIKLTDSSWENDIYEWLWEGMEKCKVRTMLSPVSKTIKIDCYRGELPCDLVTLDGVISNGYRLRQSSTILDVPKIKSDLEYSTSGSLFQTSVDKVITETTDKVTEVTTYSTIYNYPVQYLQLPYSDSDFYKLTLNKIQTSFECGEITILYLKYERDEDDLILIPDNEDLKTALYWYVLHMMIGAGFEHPLFKYQDAESRWFEFKERAINSLRNWSPDRAKEFSRTWISLMPPSPFFHNSYLLNR